MYKLTTIDLEKIECPVVITVANTAVANTVRNTTVAGAVTGNTAVTDRKCQEGQQKSFKNGAELAKTSFHQKYVISTVRAVEDKIELIVTVPDVERAVSKNDDDSFF